MTTAEFNTEFDVLYNNILSNQAPGLNPYEKSAFLTKAQLQLVQEYFNSRMDSSGGGFDGSPKRQADFSSITDWQVLQRVTQNIAKYDPRSVVYAMPKDAMFILDEQLSLLDYSSVSYSQADTDTFYSVCPISYEEYNRLMSKPYKYPPKGQAWRLLTKKKSISLVGEDDVQQYVTKHSSAKAYAKVKGTTKTIFSIEFDSYDDSNTAIKIAIATTDYDSSSLTGYSVKTLTSEEMELTIKEVLDSWVDTQSLNGLRVIVEKDYEKTTWNQLWSEESLIISVENDGSEAVESSSGDSVSEVRQLLEIIGRFPSAPYYRMRYIRKPRPIILEPRLDLLGVSLEGIGYGDGQTYTWTSANTSGTSTISECELPEEMHHEILERAVTLAKLSWQGTTMTQTALAVEATSRN